jgi:hypothetical protein
VNGNPIGVVQPVVAGVGSLVADDAPGPRERKLAATHRRLAARGALSDDEAEDVRAEVEALEQRTYDEEVWLAGALLDDGNVAAAAAHVHAADALRPEAPEVIELADRVAAALDSRAARLEASLAAVPAEQRLGWIDPDAADAYVELLAAAPLRGGCAAFAVEAERRGFPELAAALERAATASDPAARAAAAWAEVESADAAHATVVRRFVFLGERPVDDPLRRWDVARRAQDESWLDVLEPILWLPSTLFRGGWALLGDPVDEQPVADALARYVRHAPDGAPHREEALARLDELRAARAVDEDDEADDAPAVPPSGVALPRFAVLPWAAALGADPAAIEAGEPNGVRFDGTLLTIDDADGARTSLFLDADQRRIAEALAREWAWTRRAAQSSTYADLHDGLPVEFTAGFGLRGVHAYPRLLPEEYRGADRALYE